MFRITIIALSACFAAGLAACATAPVEEPAPTAESRPEPDLGILWVRDAAEYRALAIQTWTSATKDLPGMIAAPSWTALPEQAQAAELPPAIIFDVDETLVSNVEFQANFEPPFTDSKLDDWNAANEALPVPGAAEFVQLARESGVTVFFVTNRLCEPKPDVADPCPQELVTIEDLREAGILADSGNVMLAGERPEWTREKQVRRDLIAQTHRVIMLVGDDLGDFLPCVRRSVVAPCTQGATQADREALIERYGAYWGNGWYVLPNPMYGSWTQ
jgi:5'-nucleotidase (lipoprotein e(P4) family)